MIQTILLLTKSKKKNGLCVAGINTQNGEWIRLNIKKEESVPIPSFKYADGEVPEILDTIQIDVVGICPTDVHPEDVFYDPKSLSKVHICNQKLLKKRICKDSSLHKYVYYDDSHRLIDDDFPDIGEEGAYSLMAVVPEKLTLAKVEEKKILADFDYNNVHYSGLRVTDLELIKNYSQYDVGTIIEADEKVCLIISLGEKFHNNVKDRDEYYKLVASIIDISDLSEEPIHRSGDSKPDNMTASDFLEIIVSGKDPFTGEQLDDNSLLRNNIVIKALLDELQFNNWKEQKEKPPAAGTSWTEEEDARLDEEYKSGMTIGQIAEKHGRTYGAIRSRLMKHGLVE